MLFAGVGVGKTIGSENETYVEECADQTVRCKLESPLNHTLIPAKMRYIAWYGAGGVIFQASFQGGRVVLRPTRIVHRGQGYFDSRPVLDSHEGLGNQSLSSAPEIQKAPPRKPSLHVSLFPSHFELVYSLATMRLLAILPVFSAFLLHLAAASPRAHTQQAQCRCLPGDSCWPRSDVWKGLNQTVNNRLIKVVPIGAQCHDPHYDAKACEALQAQWLNPLLQSVTDRLRRQ